MAKQTNYITYLLIIGGGYAAYYLYRQSENKKTLVPDVQPLPDSDQSKKTTPQKQQPVQSKVLQDLLISLYSKYNNSTINNIKYTASEAAGGWGKLSESALKNVVPNYTTPLSLNNVNTYVNSVTALNSKRAEELKSQSTKKNDSSQLQKTASEIVKLLSTGNYKSKLLVDINSPALQYDPVFKKYRTLNESKKFSKGNVFEKGELVSRDDGTLLIVSGLKRYPINPNNLLTYTA